jgi:flagellin
MYTLGHILDTGYLAHTTLYNSYNRSADAIKALTQTEASTADSDAVVIARLLQGDIAAQGRIIHNSQTTISLLQTLDAAAAGIIATLMEMATLATSAQTGVYSEDDLAMMQSGLEDLVQAVNSVAGKTEINGYRLLSGDGEPVKIYLGNNTSTEIASTDLRLDADALDLSIDATSAMEVINDALSRTSEYRTTLATEVDRLVSQVAVDETQISRRMGYGMDITNQDLAGQMALIVISQMLADGIVVLQSLKTPETSTVAGLLK